MLAHVAGGVSGNGVAPRVGPQQAAVREALKRSAGGGVDTRTDVGRVRARRGADAGVRGRATR
jgi:hypothetical protein